MFVVLFALAVQSPAMKVNCRQTAHTQLEWNECSRQNYAVAEHELTVFWRHMSFKANKYNQRTFQRLLNGQRAWLRYRDENCGWVKDTSTSKTAYFECMEAVTLQRSEQIRMMAAQFEFRQGD